MSGQHRGRLINFPTRSEYTLFTQELSVVHVDHCGESFALGGAGWKEMFVDA